MRFAKKKGPPSPRKKMRDELGKVMLLYLKKKRSNSGTCEICGRQRPVGKFHILSVGSHPRLEFVEENILLSCWLPCHFNWHHQGPADKRNALTLARIVEKLGTNWEIDLIGRERFVGRMDEMYLLAKLHELKGQLKC